MSDCIWKLCKHCSEHRNGVNFALGWSLSSWTSWTMQRHLLSHVPALARVLWAKKLAVRVTSLVLYRCAFCSDFVIGFM